MRQKKAQHLKNLSSSWESWAKACTLSPALKVCHAFTQAGGKKPEIHRLRWQHEQKLVYMKAPQKALEHRLGEWPASMASGLWDRNKISSSWGRCLGSGRLALWQQENACMSISCGLCPSHPGIPAGRQTAATRHPKWGNNRKWAAALPNILEAVVSEFLRQKIMLQ